MTTGIEMIAHERKRQIAKEGWTVEHDDEHQSRELARAAQSYVGHYIARHWTESEAYQTENPPEEWPWEDEWWKPQSPVRDLVKAGALIAAEIDRLQRKANPKP
jgi:hypothetical protein